VDRNDGKGKAVRGPGAGGSRMRHDAGAEGGSGAEAAAASNAVSGVGGPRSGAGAGAASNMVSGIPTQRSTSARLARVKREKVDTAEVGRRH
jgi:hypothetical protein